MNGIDNLLLNLFQKLGWLKVFFNSHDLVRSSRELSKKLFNRLSGLKSEKVAIVWIREGGKSTFEDFQKNSSWLGNFSVNLQASIKISSYRENSCSGELEFAGLTPDEEKKLDGITVVVLDDLIESGKTTQGAEKYFKGLGAANVVFCFSFNKRAGHRDWTPKYFLFGEEIETDLFLVGYGLDFYDYLRDIPLVFGLKPWFFRLLGWRPLRRWFISLIEKYAKNDERFFCPEIL